MELKKQVAILREGMEEKATGGPFGVPTRVNGPKAAAAGVYNLALEDYQMQFMLLEQQNKRVFARQKQGMSD